MVVWQQKLVQIPPVEVIGTPASPVAAKLKSGLLCDMNTKNLSKLRKGREKTISEIFLRKLQRQDPTMILQVDVII